MRRRLEAPGSAPGSARTPPSDASPNLKVGNTPCLAPHPVAGGRSLQSGLAWAVTCDRAEEILAMTLHSTPPEPVLVMMGVSGTGKSTVAGLLAGYLGWDLAEGDDMHPAANIAKMAAGHPLDDA